MNEICIIGVGEVGDAINKLYIKNNTKPLLFDPYKNLKCDLSNVKIVNICIPCKCSDSFVIDVTKILNTIKDPQLVIVHSSIVLGTIESLKNNFKGVSIVHSPIRGVHPFLYKGIVTFVKYVGYIDGHEKDGNYAKEHLESLGLKVTTTTSKTTILMKLLSTTYYGMCIAYTEEMGKICDKEDIDFEMISDWTKTYNEGYVKLDKANVCRPYLLRIPDGKHIGGHCVIPNAKLLKDMYPELTSWDYVLQFE